MAKVEPQEKSNRLNRPVVAGQERSDRSLEQDQAAYEPISGARAVEALQSFLGNELVLEALSGEQQDGFCSFVGGNLSESIASQGSRPSVLHSNTAMLKVMRDAHIDWEAPGLQRLNQMGGGRALPADKLNRFNQAFQHDFSHVRIHTDAAASQAAEALNAHAFALGAHIFFGKGTYGDGRSADRLLAHELTHVLQHDEGRLPSSSSTNEVSNPSDPSEQEAYANEVRVINKLDAIDAAPSEGLEKAVSSNGDNVKSTPIAHGDAAENDSGHEADVGGVESSLEKSTGFGGDPAEGGNEGSGDAEAVAMGGLAMRKKDVLSGEKTPEEQVLEFVDQRLGAPMPERVAERVGRAFGAAEAGAHHAPASLLDEEMMKLATKFFLGPQGSETDFGLSSLTAELSLMAFFKGASPQMQSGIWNEAQALVFRLATQLGISGVQLHMDEFGQEKARAAGGRGLAEGKQVFLDLEGMRPGSSEARKLIAHEMAHVAQQGLAPAAGPFAAGIAEAEADAFADSFVASGEVSSVAFGIPQGHVAGNEGGELAPVNVNLERALLEYSQTVDSVLANMLSDAAFQDLVSTYDTGEAEGGECSEDGTSASTESDTSDGSAAEESSQSLDPDTLIEEIKGSATYAELVDAYGKTLIETTQQTVIIEFKEEFDNRVLAMGLGGPEAQALDDVLYEAIVSADELQVCQTISDVDAEVGEFPVDPNSFICIDGSLEEESGVDVDMDQDDSCEDVPLEEQKDKEKEPAAADFEVPTPEAKDVSASPSVGALLEGGETVVEVEADLDLCSYFSEHAGEGAGIHLDRLPDIWTVMKESAVGPFWESATTQFKDTLILDTLGTVGDKVLSNYLAKIPAAAGSSKVPIIGPLLTLGMKGKDIGEVFFDDEKGLLDAFPEFKQITDGFGEFGSMFGNFKEAGEALWKGDFSDFGFELIQAQTDYCQGLALITGGLAGVCGLLSALLFVAAFVLPFTAAGAPFAPICFAAAKTLGEAATVLGIVCLWARGAAAMWSGVAAAMAPTDEYETALKDVEESSKAFGEKAGEFAGDMAGQQAGKAAVATGSTIIEAGKILVERPASESPETSRDAAAEGQTTAAGQGETVKSKTERIKELVTEKLPTFKKDGATGGSLTVKSVASKGLAVLGKITQITTVIDSLTNMESHLGELSTLLSNGTYLDTAELHIANAEQVQRKLETVKVEVEQAANSLAAVKDQNIPEIRELQVEIEQLRQQGADADDFHAELSGLNEIVDHASQLQVQINSAESTLLLAEGDLRAADLHMRQAQMHANAAQEVAGTEAHQTFNEDPSAPAAPVSDTVNSEDFGGQSSGNATGDVGSIYTPVLEDLGRLFGLIDAAKGDIKIVDSALDSCVGSTEEMINTPPEEAACEESGVDPDCDKDAFIEEHGVEIDDAILEIDQVVADAQALTTQTDVDAAALGEQAVTAMDAREAQLNQEASVYAVEGVEGLVGSVADIYPDADMLEPVKAEAAGFGAKLDATIIANESAAADLQENSAPSESIPNTFMSTLEEGKALFSEHGDLTDSPGADLSAPEGDPASMVEASTDAADQASSDLSVQLGDLVDQKARVDEVVTQVGDISTGLATDKAALESSKEEIAAVREGGEAGAAVSEGEAESAAAEAIAGISALGAKSGEIRTIVGKSTA